MSDPECCLGDALNIDSHWFVDLLGLCYHESVVFVKPECVIVILCINEPRMRVTSVYRRYNALYWYLLGLCYIFVLSMPQLAILSVSITVHRSLLCQYQSMRPSSRYCLYLDSSGDVSRHRYGCMLGFAYLLMLVLAPSVHITLLIQRECVMGPTCH